MTLIFDTYGRLAPDGANAILVTHGYTGSHRAAGPPTPANPAGGWWKGLIGPGLALDTDRYFVVSSNMLGSSYGSTGPNSVNPATGKPYGPAFPDITLGDIVRAQRLMLDSLGVRHLVAVAGQSFGGFQAFQWAISYPDFMEGIVASVTAPKGSGRRGVGAGVARPARRRSQLERRLALRARRHARHHDGPPDGHAGGATAPTRSSPPPSPIQ